MSAVGSPELWPWVGTEAALTSLRSVSQRQPSSSVRAGAVQGCAQAFLRAAPVLPLRCVGRGGRLGAVTAGAGPRRVARHGLCSCPVPRAPCPGGALALAVPLLRGTGVAKVCPFPVGRAVVTVGHRHHLPGQVPAWSRGFASPSGASMTAQLFVLSVEPNPEELGGRHPHTVPGCEGLVCGTA